MYLHLSNNGEESSKLLMDHKSEDAHHCGTAIVELDGTLTKLCFLIEGVPSKVNCPIPEVPNEFGIASDILHDTKLQESDEGDDLGEAGGGNGIRSKEGGNTVGVGVEGMARVVNVTREMNASTGGDLSEEGKLADTSVLDLYETKTVESILVGIIEESEGVKEAEWGLSAKLGLEGGERSDGLGHGGGGECGGRAEDGNEAGGLHDSLKGW